jgi:imidazolonepropionase
MLAPGQRANFVLWDAQQPAQLAYAIGANPCRQVVFEGKVR